MLGLFQQSISLLAVALRNGKTTSVALAEEMIENHGRWGVSLDAYKCRQDDQFLAEARAADAAFASLARNVLGSLGRRAASLLLLLLRPWRRERR